MVFRKLAAAEKQWMMMMMLIIVRVMMSSGKKEACATSIYPKKCSMDCVCHGSELPNDNLVNCVHFFKEYINNQLDEVELRQKVHLSIFFGQPCFMVCTTALRGQM
jgi:hypothetical protein